MAPPQLPRIPRPPMNSSRLTFPHGSQYRVGTPTPTSIRLVHWALGTHARRAVRRQLATAHIRAERCAGNWPRPRHTYAQSGAPAIGHGAIPPVGNGARPRAMAGETAVGARNAAGRIGRWGIWASTLALSCRKPSFRRLSRPHPFCSYQYTVVPLFPRLVGPAVVPPREPPVASWLQFRKLPFLTSRTYSEVIMADPVNPLDPVHPPDTVNPPDPVNSPRQVSSPLKKTRLARRNSSRPGRGFHYSRRISATH